MKPKELLFSHHYLEAIEAYQAHLACHPDQNYYPGLGRALLASGRYSEAVVAFQKANEMENSRLLGCMPCINELATALWLKEEKQRATSEWQLAIKNVLADKIRYADAFGGARQGLLLLYGAITTKNAEQHKYALDFLLLLNSKKANQAGDFWPRPIVQMALGKNSFSNTVETIFGTSDFKTCFNLATDDLLKRRCLCQTLFYQATCERQNGNEPACMEFMRLCSSMENPIIEPEWYLARNETIKT